MGLFGTSDPVKREEKMLANGLFCLGLGNRSRWLPAPLVLHVGTFAISPEAKHDDKTVKNALKDVAHAEKSEHNATKQERSAHATHEKAVKTEAKLQSELEKLTHKHNDAVSKANATANEAQRKSAEHQRIVGVAQQSKANLDHVQHTHKEHSIQRDQKLAALHESHAPVDPAPGTGAPVGQTGAPGIGAVQTGGGGGASQPVGGRGYGGTAPGENGHIGLAKAEAINAQQHGQAPGQTV
ncbi:hypothetical protein TREMEDRAFT_58701 [Tremella mesenterica DSM 1558]|uniref:uncharacterized protein n=1 Tax=Tremella mesenterica (strain ATCC 24925 / CBS 8224 / DSM 1558 / NBRC 9311 / NRRL Y-6157 / RJB 2259-6 / UBC 559-6) TaxID=578456 RepID=UPI0003F49BB4|nr:uncharacterized protein TREMEDRAFT_58701 [Tremella mesenterica DSM 1558]EIW72529.1 hypothetical protein TREMEDRAFT_58701 [Tremella mesenterica DSM 1558]